MMIGESEQPTTRKRILIVDDEKIIRDLLEEAFETYRAGYEVTLAADGLAAYDLLRQQAFDLIITDWKMPGLGGLELAEAVHQYWPQTRIALITAHSTRLSNPIIKPLGFHAYLAKPFSLAEIFELVDRLLERRPLKTA